MMGWAGLFQVSTDFSGGSCRFTDRNTQAGVDRVSDIANDPDILAT
ncbi:MAG: hypothetical protein ACR2PX_09235 [Endozoicomonas sp.]